MTMPSNSATTNVLKVVHAGLWAIFEADVNFAACVEQLNRIAYNNNDQPAPELAARLTSDSPAVRIVPNGWTRPARGSNMFAMAQSFELQVLTNDQRTSWYYDDVKLAAILVVMRTMGALPSWSMPTGTTLQKIEMDSGTDQLADIPTDGQTTRGWVGALTITVHFSFNVQAVTS